MTQAATMLLRAQSYRGADMAPPRPAALADGDGPTDHHLARARRAAAEARARTAQIRAEAQEALTLHAAEPPPAAAAPAVADPPPEPAREPRAAPPAPPAPPAAERRSRGLSVAAAARASTIAFRPVRRAVRPAAPATAGAPAAAPAGPPRPAATVDDAQQRFTRTVAELERYLAASRADDPGSNVIPRPTLPLEHQESAGAGWLWRRSWRRAGAAG